MKVVIHLDRGRPTAGSHALYFFERKLPVGRRFLVPDAQRFRSVFVKLSAAHQQTTDVGANLDVSPALRLGVQHGVVADYFIYLERRYFATPGYFLNQLV